MPLQLRKRVRESRAVQLLLLILCLAWPVKKGWDRVRQPSETQLLRKAIQLADRGYRDMAAELLDEVLRRNPAQCRALLIRGQLAHDAGRARKAEAAFLKASQLNPEFPEPHEGLLKLYAVQLRSSEIRRELRALRRFRDWKLPELYQLVNATGEAVNRAEAIPRLKQFAEADPDDLHSLAALGRYYLWDDRPGNAAAVLRRALDSRPNDSTFRALLAEALLKAIDVDGARDVLRETTAGRDSPQRLWRSYGLCLAAGGEWRRAAACLHQAVAMHPWDRPAVFQLGLALEQAGDVEEANGFFQRAELLVQLKAAMFRFVQAPDNHPEVATAALMQTGQLLTTLGRFEEAAPFFEQVLEWDSNWPGARASQDDAVQQERIVPAEPDSVGMDQSLKHAIAAAGGLLAVPSGTPAIASASAAVPPIRFADRHREAGIDFQFFNGARGQKYLLETTGGGVAVLDYDADGWPDLFFPQGGSIPLDFSETTYPDRLYRNRGDETFTDVSAETGLTDRQYS